MKKLLTIICLLFYVAGGAQWSTTYILRDTATTVDTPLRADAGLIEFGTTHFIDYPVAGVTNNHPYVLYQRWKFCEIMTGFNTFNYSDVDAKFNAAIDRGQMVGFGLEPISDFATCNTVGGAKLSYPVYLHNQMQAESVKDWIGTDGNQWVPNWNSTNWKAAWDYLLRRFRGHLDSTSHNGHRYIDYVYQVDSREFGNYGEDHTYGSGHGQTIPAGAQASDATLKALFTSVKTYFPDKPIIMNINALYGSHPDSDVPASYGYFLLTDANNVGRYGIRVDHVGNPGPFTAKDYTNNVTTFNGLSFKTEIGNRWKENYILGEPEQSGYQQAGQCDYSFTKTYITTLHIENIENANIQTAASSCVQTGFRSHAKLTGWRYFIQSITMSDSIIPNGNFVIQPRFSNIGIAPSYEKYDVTYELWQGATFKTSWASTIQPQFFLPGVQTFNDNHIMTGTWSGVYDLYIRFKHSKNIWPNMPLQQSGRQFDGKYLLRTGIGVATQGSTPPPPPPPVNNPPQILIGANQIDTLPKNVDSLYAQIGDPNNDNVSYTWSQNSGPNTATMATPTGSVTTFEGASSIINRISGLILGQYSFRLTANDGKGGISVADMTVAVVDTTVALPPPPPPPPPIYRPPLIDAGDTIHTTLPKDSVTLQGHVTRHDTTFTVLWSRVSASGATNGTIVTPADSTTIVRGLSKGYYLYKYTVTDRAGNKVEDFVYVFVDDPATDPEPMPLPGPPGKTQNTPILKRPF
jgi:hypothetical protein